MEGESLEDRRETARRWARGLQKGDWDLSPWHCESPQMSPVIRRHTVESR